MIPRFDRAGNAYLAVRWLSWTAVGLLAFPASSLSAPCSRFSFVEVTAASGVVFRHRNGATGDKHLPETMGSGAAWLDFDGDGWLDLYLVQSGAYPPVGGAEAANALFRNRGNGVFTALPEAAGAAHRGYGQGALAADLDGDGDIDLFVTNVGPDALLVNQGDGTFAEARLPPPPNGATNWSSSVAAADGDGDGDLDLYIARYVDYDPDGELFCGDSRAGRRIYCDPALFAGQPDRYLQNRGDGSFTDTTAEAGLAGAHGRGLGVVFVDLDGDGAADVYVANDATLNLLFHNRGDGRFEDVGLRAGVAVNRDGKAEAGMGVGVGDFDHDGDPDLAVTNFDVESNTLYLNRSDRGTLLFEDVSTISGFGLPSFNLLGFGLVVADFDRDGHLDAYIANGHIFEHPKRENVHYRQPDLLLAGDGDGGFVVQPCDWLAARPRVARGAAAADFDNDGDVDLVLSHSDGTPSLWRNEADDAASWLGVELLGRAPNTQAVGAKVVLLSSEGRQTRWLLAGGSYLSSSDRRLLFGLGPRPPRELEIQWPRGRRQRLLAPPGRHYLRVVERSAATATRP